MPSGGGGGGTMGETVAGHETQILVIEDEPKIATLVSRTLAAAGFKVTSAGSAQRGLKHLEREAFSLVILDLILPDIDGFSVLDRALDLAPDQRVLVLSALSDMRSKVRCLELGACDYVTKPFDLPELVARVRLRLQDGRRTENDQRFIHVAAFTLDTQRRVAVIGEVQISLATREFRLLEHLARKHGEVCSREELLEGVWGYAFDPGTNVVEVCIGRLRHKLGGDVIETIRNVGYCIAA
jgi:two-component system copper resistance phosphate regulon response regulator CusR